MHHHALLPIGVLIDSHPALLQLHALWLANLCLALVCLKGLACCAGMPIACTDCPCLLVITEYVCVYLQTVADLGTISAVSIQGSGSSSWASMTNTFGAAWEVDNCPSYPISLEVTSGSQTVSTSVDP